MYIQRWALQWHCITKLLGGTMCVRKITFSLVLIRLVLGRVSRIPYCGKGKKVQTDLLYMTFKPKQRNNHKNTVSFKSIPQAFS